MPQNYSFHAIPAAYILTLVPTAWAHFLVSSKKSLRTPRDISKRLEKDQSVPQSIKRKVFALQSAAQNGTDNLSLVVAAVLLANLTNMDATWANVLSGIYIALRGVYVIAYGTGIWKLRSFSFWVGQGCLWTLFGMGLAQFGREKVGSDS